MKILFLFVLLIITSAHSQTNNEDEIICPIEKLPYFSYGNDSLFRFIYSKIKIPKEYSQTLWEANGKVFVRFNVEKNGKLSNFTILKGMKDFPKLNDAVLKAVRQIPKWEAGEINGKPTRIGYVLPIKFSYDLVYKDLVK
jgi:periplasmic protein TonB